MWIGKEVLMIEEVQVEKPSTWVIVWHLWLRNKVYCNNNMLYIGSLDEEIFSGHTGGI
jgi:hypothetical protein